MFRGDKRQKLIFKHLLFKDRHSSRELIDFVSNFIGLIEAHGQGNVKLHTADLRMLLERMQQRSLKSKSSFQTYKHVVLKEMKNIALEMTH